jgi:hypothetical protein
VRVTVTVDKSKVSKKEKDELMTMIGGMKSEIVDRPDVKTNREFHLSKGRHKAETGGIGCTEERPAGGTNLQHGGRVARKSFLNRCLTPITKAGSDEPPAFVMNPQ